MPPLVDELDLYVTATDLTGNRLATQLWNTTSWERRHANRYHFRRAPQEGRNDFERRDNSFLAFAARCTSAFPFAFSAMTLNDIERFAGAKPIEDEWSRFYPDYVTGDFPVRGFSDGGILDNKPFSYATGALVGRRAPLPVDRKLIYVEPDPGDPPPEPLAPEPARQWNGIQTAQAALLKIPRVEGIRNDIQTVLRRNREIERARDIVSRAATDQVEYESIRAVALETDTAATGASSTSRNRAPAQLGPRVRDVPPAQGARRRRLPRDARRARGAGVQRRLRRRARGALPRPRLEGRAVLGAAEGGARRARTGCCSTSASRTAGAG